MKPWMLALFSRQPLAHSVTLTGTTSFTAPAGVSRVYLSGHGANGTPATTAMRYSGDIRSTVYNSSGTGTAGTSLDWASLNADIDAMVSSMNTSYSADDRNLGYQVYPDGTYTYTDFGPVSLTTTDLGSAVKVTGGAWGTSGAVTSNGHAGINYMASIAATDGAAATAFGQTFPGGTAGGVAPTTTYDNVAVIPGTTYSVTLPAGAAVTVTYYT